MHVPPPLKELIRRPSIFDHHKQRKDSSGSFSALEIHTDANSEAGSIIAYNPDSPGVDGSRWSPSIHRTSISTQSIRRKPVPSEFSKGPGSTSWESDEVEGDLGLIEPITIKLENEMPSPSPSNSDTINFRRLPPIVSSPTVNISSPSSDSPSPDTFNRPSASNRIQLNARTRVLYGSNSNSPTTPNSPIARAISTTKSSTKAPIESFGSYDMLQGERDHAELRRGSEIFGKSGYEGRAMRKGSQSFSKASKKVSVAPKLPELDLSSIASSLRRRSTCSPHEPDDYFKRRFSSTSSQGDVSLSPQLPNNHSFSTFFAERNFTFPSNVSPGIYVTAAPDRISPTGLDLVMADEIIADRSPYTEKSMYGDRSPSFDHDQYYEDSHLSSEELVLGSSTKWSKEGNGWSKSQSIYSSKSNDQHIVALPVYPSPGGTTDRSASYRFKKIGVTFSVVTSLFAQLATLIYMVERIRALIVVEQKMPGVFVTGWVFLSVEICLAIIFAFHAFTTAFTAKPLSTQPKLRLRGDSNLPTVDVLIIASGQSDQVVFDSAVAAASIDYPIHRFRVLVIDPLGSASLQKKLTLHAKTQGAPHLTYHHIALDTLNSKAYHSKSNSINFGASGAQSMGTRGGGEFIAVFDADMIPERNYLRAVLPAFIGSVNVALALVPHGFINLPRRINQATSTMMTAAESSNLRSGFMLRRAGLEAIGGFPVDSSIHHGECSALLMGKGYTIATLDEVLQFTCAKPTYQLHVKAMMKDGLGALRTASRLNFFIGGNKISQMSARARLSYLSSGLRPFLSIVLYALMLSYPYMFSYGGIMVLTPSYTELVFFLELTLAMVVLDRIHEWMFVWSTSLPSPRRQFQSWLFAAPYQNLSLLFLILPWWMGGYRKGDIEIKPDEVEVQRDSFGKRLLWLILDPHFGVVLSFTASIGVCIWRAANNYELGTIDSHQIALTILLTIAWPSLVYLDFIFASSVPFFCLLFPSTLLTEPRDAFLVRDHYTSIARPRYMFKTCSPLRVQRFPEFVTGFVMIGFSAAIVVTALLTDTFR